MLQQSEALAPLGAIAVQHRERLDGSGYPRGLSGGASSRAARILGAAEAYQAMREPRPHDDASARAGSIGLTVSLQSRHGSMIASHRGMSFGPRRRSLPC